MKNFSIWKDNIDMPKFNRLDSKRVVDVLIIGGGMTGINTLYQLRNSSLEVILVEQNRVGMSVTSNSTGKLTYLQDNLYEKIKNSYDGDVASKYLKSQRDAVDMAVDIIRNEKVDCDLVKTPSFVFGNTDDEVKSLDILKEFLTDNGVEVIEGDCNLIDYKSMIGVRDTYLFHPLKYIKGLIDKVDKNSIYECTSIVRIEKSGDRYICFTDRDFEISVKDVVIASHYPYFNLPFLFPIKGNLEKSYLSASKYHVDNLSLIKYNKPVISIRSYFDYLIYLSNSYNISIDSSDKDNYLELRNEVKKLGLVPEYMWSNVDIMTNDGLPYIGEVKDNLLLGTGYNTWGMANGVLAGKILADIILKIDNEYIDLFRPSRFNKSILTMAFVDGYYSAVGYVKGLSSNNENITYSKSDGKEIATYCDSDGEHIVYTRCPHLGCRLIFNEVEKTWDCPCHASRFDIDGKCISGPANKDITVK